jgi:hypothetical protein
MTAHRKEFDAERLLELSDQVSRIATTLARLSTDPDCPAAETNTGEAAAEWENIGRAVTAVIQARRLRAHYFDEELFADPAWDMMLDLFRAELCQRRIATSSLCVAAAVPATTALRWIKAMTEKGLFVRHDDPFDGRRVYIELAPEVSEALRRYFAKIADTPVI